MAQVAVSLNGREYVVTCGDGEEAHVTALARTVDAKVAELVKALGQIGEARLLAMASILLADELHDFKSARPAVAPAGGDATLDQFARRLEELAARLESA
ncbi:MAG: cell division protein ZapA [Alphaproteobacteria bacterium]